jgi:hypothetical protein
MQNLNSHNAQIHAESQVRALQTVNDAVGNAGHALSQMGALRAARLVQARDITLNFGCYLISLSV